MYKALALTALAGSVAAAPWTKVLINPFAITNSDASYTYYSAAAILNFDTGYQTQYNRENPIRAMYPDNSQQYAFNIFSWVKMTFTHEAFQSY